MKGPGPSEPSPRDESDVNRDDRRGPESEVMVVGRKTRTA